MSAGDHVSISLLQSIGKAADNIIGPQNATVIKILAVARLSQRIKFVRYAIRLGRKVRARVIDES